MTPFGKMSPFGFMRGWENPFLGPFWRAGKKRATAPTVTQAFSRDGGNVLRVHFNKNVTHVSEPTVTASGGAATLTYSAGTGTRVLSYATSRALSIAEVQTLDFAGGEVTSAGVPIAAVADIDIIPLREVSHGEEYPVRLAAEVIRSNGTGGGSFTTGATWAGGVAPTAADDWIAESGDTLTVDDELAVGRTGLVYTGAKLEFDATVNSKLILNTLTIAGTGIFEMGTSGTPIAADKKARLVIRNSALPAQAIDPRQFTNGIIVLDTGTFRVYGSPKTSDARLLRLAVSPMATDTTLTMEFAPSGWRIGDTIAIPPTAHVHAGLGGFAGDFEAETFTISNIVDEVITLDHAVEYDHPGAVNHLGTTVRRCHVINLTRSAAIESESAAGVRGHILITDRAVVDTEDGETLELGRTTGARTFPGVNGSEFGDSFDNTIYDEDTGILTHYGLNQAGRYPLHLHHHIGPVTDPDVTTITLGGTPDGGTFKLVYIDADAHPIYTDPINWNATGATLASNIQAALDALHGASEVTVTGTGPFTLTSAGTVPQAVGVVNNLTGTDPTVDAGYQAKLVGWAVNGGKKWGITIHGSGFNRIERCNGYNFHAAFISLETGAEWYNYFRYNCGIYCVGTAATDSVSNVFWGMNGGNNNWISNVGGGAAISVYDGHIFHLLDNNNRGATAATLVRRPTSRGADVVNGVENTDYVVEINKRHAFIEVRGNEGYSCLTAWSTDHYGGPVAADNPEIVLGALTGVNDDPNADFENAGLHDWNCGRDGTFTYGGKGAVTFNGYTSYGYGQQGFAPNSWGELVTLRNFRLSSPDQIWVGQGIPYGAIFNIGASGERSRRLLMEHGHIYTGTGRVPIDVWFSPTAENGPPDSSTPSSIVTVRNVLGEREDAGAVMLSLGGLSQGGAITAAPCSLHQVFVEDFQQSAGDDFQAFWEEQGADELAPDIATYPNATQLSPTPGLTNQEAWDTHAGYVFGGEVPPVGTTTRADVDGLVAEMVLPTLSSATIAADGETWTLVFSEDVTSDGTGFSGDASVTGAVGLTYVSGSGTNTLVFTGSVVVESGETVTLDYAAGTGDVADDLGNLLASITDAAVTNNSEQGGGFSPADLPTLRAWYTADPAYCFQDAGASTPCGDGDPVYTWTDRSGLGHHLVQADSGKRPILRTTGGVWRVDFDGTDDFMAAASYTQSGTGGQYMGLRYRLDSAGSFPTVFSVNAGARELRGNGSNEFPEALVTAGGGSLIDPTSIVGSAWVATIANHDYAGDTATLYRNGSSVDTDTDSLDPVSSHPANQICMGSRGGSNLFWPGGVREAVYGEAALDAGEVTSLNGYLST